MNGGNRRHLFEMGEGEVVHEVLARAVEEDREALLVSFTSGEGVEIEHHSRGEIWDASLKLAAHLSESGVGIEDRVAFLIGNRVELVVAWFACSMVGAIAVPLNTALKGTILDHELRLTMPRAIFVETTFLAGAQGSVAAAESIAEVILIAAAEPAPDGGFGPDQRVLSYGECFGHEPLAELAPVTRAHTSTIIFTSGTTGRSKGVQVTHAMTMSEADAARWVMGYERDDVAHTCLPLYHGNALLTSFFAALRTGARTVVADRFSASNFWQQAARTEATTTNMLGSMSTILWRSAPSEWERRHRLRLGMVIPSPLEYYEEFKERFGMGLTELYGLTDSQIPLGVPFGESRPGSCGMPTPDWECDVFGPDDEPLRPGEVGELVTRPRRPFVGFVGYWGNVEASWGCVRNQWFHTGDLVYRDEDGWYFFVDRMKDAIRRRGENVSSFEVEEVLLGHPEVREAAVYAVKAEEDMLEDEVMASMMLRGGSEDAAAIGAEILAYCDDRLPYFAVPRYYRVVVQFERTENHKVRKAALREEGITADAWDAGERGLKAISKAREARA